MSGALSLRQVLAVHEGLLLLHGGTPGVKDLGLLERALAQPTQELFGQLRYEGPVRQAATYLFFIIKNHAFNNGNKRTASACMLIWLEAHDIGLRASDEALAELCVGVADSSLPIEYVFDYLEFHRT